MQGGPLDEPEAPDAQLPLAEAVRRAAGTSPALQEALARVRVALADAGQARLLSNPVLNLVFRVPRGSGEPSFEVSIVQEIVGMLRIPRAASAADNRLRQSAADAVTQALDVVEETEQRYATVQALDELMPVLQRRLEIVTRLLRQEQTRLQRGEGRRQDVASLDSQRIDLEVEIAEREREQRDERLRLTRLIGSPSGAATWTLDSWSAPVQRSANESAWIERGLAHRPEVQSAGWKLAALGDERALAELLPWAGASAELGAERSDSGGDWNLRPALSLPLPIFDTGQARRERLTAEQIEARHGLTLAKRQVVEDVRRAVESLRRNEANLKRVREQLIPLQEQRRTLAEASFRAGQSDVTVLLLAEQDLQAALGRAVQLERETTSARIRLDRAVGGSGIAKETK